MAYSYLKKINERSAHEQLAVWQRLYDVISNWGEQPFPLLFSVGMAREKIKNKIQYFQQQIKEGK